ncbi:MAG: ribonuclease J [Candidatus Liptonbacteria bacterium]|nr:ribonuclease J [Candidatus Liptonbacteria bacterium]
MTQNTSRGRAPRAHGSHPPAARHSRPQRPRQEAPRGHAPAHAQHKESVIKRENQLRFIPLGGLEEVGRNCQYFEYGREIVVVDVGIQFPEEATPGIDYIIPNVASLENRKQDVKAIILTHGHYDHIAAIHYLVEKLGNPPIITSAFTKAMVEKRHEEFTNAPKLNFITVKDGSRVPISEHFVAEFFAVGHTIPEALGFILHTPAGKMVNFGDFRLDIDRHGEPTNMDIFHRLAKENIHSLFVDSTNAEFPGFSASERTVEENLEMLIKGARGRIIIATFASLVDRLLEIIKIAARLGRKIAVNGRSMKTNLDIAKHLGYFKEIKDQIIPLEEVNKHRDENIIILTTGAQGEPNAGLMRIVRGEHRVVRLKPADTVVFSSSVVPGNERSVQALQDNIARQVDEVYKSDLLDIHASGHARSEDIKLILKIIKPKFIVPIHGYYFKRKALIKIARDANIEKNRVIMMDNGQVAEIHPEKFLITEEKVPATYVMVDGLGVGDVEEVVLRDRLNLSKEGMVVVIVTLDRRTGRILKNPDIISRGFIFLKENQTILEDIRKKVRAVISRLPAHQEVETDYLKTLIRDQVGQFLYTKTKRRPMILPVTIEI